jgi:hypothetical protein
MHPLDRAESDLFLSSKLSSRDRMNVNSGWVYLLRHLVGCLDICGYSLQSRREPLLNNNYKFRMAQVTNKFRFNAKFFTFL